MHITLLDNSGTWYVDHYQKTAQEIFAQWLGEQFTIMAIPVAEFTELPTDTEAVMLSGSPANVTDAFNIEQQNTIASHMMLTHKQVYDTNAKVLQAAMAKQLPVLGVCYGHQVLGQYFNGKVSTLETAIPLSTASVLMTSLGIQLTQPVSHRDYVAELSKDSHLLFENADGLVYGAIFSKQPLMFGVQFHPELTPSLK